MDFKNKYLKYKKKYTELKNSLIGGNENLVEENISGVGGWSGTCTCPDGKQYKVGDNNNACASIACIDGVPSGCSRDDLSGLGRRVTCYVPYHDKFLEKCGIEMSKPENANSLCYWICGNNYDGQKCNFINMTDNENCFICNREIKEDCKLVLVDNNFICPNCGYKCDDQQQFTEHIMNSGNKVTMNQEDQIITTSEHCRGKPIILNLRLHENYDPGRALKDQTQVLDLFKQNCQDYNVLSIKRFSSYAEIISILQRYTKKIIAHFILLTHGSPDSITLGSDPLRISPNEVFVNYNGIEQIQPENPRFREFTVTLNNILLPKASILLAACLTGKNETWENMGNLQGHIVTLTNCIYKNFANRLSNFLPNHPIYCTPDYQVAGELNIFAENPDGVSLCSINNDNPLYYSYVSSNQLMYKYIRKDNDSGNAEEIKKCEPNLRQIM